MIEYHDLNEEQQSKVLSACMGALSAVTEVFGLEQGEQLYSKIADGFGPGVKDAILFAMLTGQHSGVTLHTAVGVTRYVELIKVVRAYTGFGLKEAKDACDLARSGQIVRFTVAPNRRHEFIRAMNNEGARAS